jgi:hypothetical protein
MQMLKRLSLLLIFILLISALAGCGTQKTTTPIVISTTTTATTAATTPGTQLVFLNVPFTLAPGQTARIESEGMDIRFVNVTGDSRCPQGVECIWAGQVTCAMEITKNNILNQVTLTDSAGSGASTGQDFQNYQILFSVTPSPVAGQTTAGNDYRLTMTVSQLRY